MWSDLSSGALDEVVFVATTPAELALHRACDAIRELESRRWNQIAPEVRSTDGPSQAPLGVFDR
jgi:hypothetical protein